MPGHCPNAGLEEGQRFADDVSELDPSQVDDDRNALALPGLEYLQITYRASGERQKNIRISELTLVQRSSRNTAAQQYGTASAQLLCYHKSRKIGLRTEAG